jgi:hypothetical protein
MLKMASDPNYTDAMQAWGTVGGALFSSPWLPPAPCSFTFCAPASGSPGTGRTSLSANGKFILDVVGVLEFIDAAGLRWERRENAAPVRLLEKPPRSALGRWLSVQFGP